MKGKLVAVVTTVAMTVALMPTFSFALNDDVLSENAEVIMQEDSESEDSITQEDTIELSDAEDVAEIVEILANTQDVLSDVDEGDDELIVAGENSEIIIPEDGDGEVAIEGEDGETFAMSLPKQFSSMDGELAGDGTVVYNNDSSHVSAVVQGVQEEQGDIVLEGFRSLVIIENADAPHKYDFEFNLPEGCKLVIDGEYINIVNENNMITDENGEQFYEIIGSIDPAWAKDSNGYSVDTYYRLNGNTISQVVEFNAESAFPIIADPTATAKPKSKYVSTKSINCNISHSVIGVGSFVAGSGFKALTASAKRKVVKAVAAKLGSKVIPIVSWGAWTLTGYATLASGAGYNYTKITGSYEVWTYYKKQGGQWVQGYQYRNGKMKCKLVK